MKKRQFARNRKWLCVIIGIILFAILLFPMQIHALDDGGTVSYGAMIYTVTIVRSLWEEDGYDGLLVGTQIRVFNRIIFDNTRFERFDTQ